MEPATMSAYDPNWTSADVEAGGLAENNQGAFRTCREVAMIFYSSPEKMCGDIGNFVMTMRYITVCVGALIMALALQGAPAQALSMKECSAKYKAAKEAGTLNSMKWNDFRKAQCGTEATEAPPTAPPPAETPSPKPAATGNAVFPSTVSPRYSSESPVRPACIPVSISTGSIKRTAETVRSNGFKRVAVITANATNALRGKPRFCHFGNVCIKRGCRWPLLALSRPRATYDLSPLSEGQADIA